MRSKEAIAKGLIARHAVLKTGDYKDWQDKELYNLLDELERVFKAPIQSAKEKEEQMRLLAMQQSRL